MDQNESPLVPHILSSLQSAITRPWNRKAWPVSGEQKSLKKFLWGIPFTLRTDHSALEQLLQGPGKAEKNHHSSKLIHWADRLGAFDFTIQHMPGKDNSFADALSRLPLPSTTFALHELSRNIILKRIAANGITLT